MIKLPKAHQIAFPKKISLIYLTISLIWIAFSDRAVEMLFTDSQTLSAIQTMKGSGFVLFTAFLLYRLIRRHISSLSKAQQIIHKREQQYQQVFESNPQPMWVYDPETLRFIAVNNAAIEHYGYSRNEFLNMTLKDIRPPTSVPALLEDVASKSTQPKVWEHRVKDGSLIDVEIRRGTFQVDGGERRLVLARDVTELQTMEKRLEESEQLYRNLVDSSPDVIIVYSDNKILFINPAGLNLFNVELETVLNRNVFDLLDKDRHQSIVQFLEEAKRTDDTQYVREIELYLGEDRELNLDVSVTQIVFKGEKAKQVIVRDVSRRKQAEKELKESEARFRIMSEANRAGTYIVQHGVIQFGNLALFEIFGYQADEVIGKMGPLDFVHPDDQERAIGIIQARLRGEAVVDDPIYKAKHKNGHTLYIQVFGNSAIYQGEPALIGTMMDVTEQHKTALSLRESEERFRILTEANIAGIYIIQDNIVQYANPAILAIFGYRSDEVIGKLGPLDFVHPDDRDRIIEMMQRRLNGTVKEERYTFTGITKMGSIIYIEVFGTTTSYSGKPALIGTMIDVTERYNASNALQRSEANMRAILDNTLQAFILFDRDVKIQTVNRVAQQWAMGILGKPIEPGDNAKELFSAFDMSLFDMRVSRVLAGGSFQDESQISAPDGTRWFEVSYNPVVVEGEVTGVAMSVLDISRRKNEEYTRKILAQANASLIESLELDTVLSTIIDYAQQLVNFDTCSVVLPNDQNQMVFKMTRGIGEAYGYEPFEKNQYPEILQLISTQRSVVVDDISLLSHWHEDLPQYFRSWMGVPLVAGGTFLGLFAVEKREPSFFTEKYIQDLEALATHAAVAIKNAQLYQQIETYAFGLEANVQERTKELQKEYKRRDGLAKIELAINEQHELQTLMEQTVDIVKDVLDVTIGCSLILLNPEGDQFYISATNVPAQPPLTAARYVRNRGGATRWVIDHGEPIIVSDTANDPFGANRMIIDYGVKAYIGYPLIYDDKNLGVLYMLDNYTREYEADEINMLQQFALRVAVAINRVELYTQLSKTNQELVESAQALAVRIERTTTIVNSNNNGIVLLSIENGIQEANATFQTLTKSSLATYIGNPLSDFVCPDDQDILQKAIDDALNHPIQHIELCMIRSDRTTFDAELALAPVAQLASENVQLVCTIHDITQRKQMETALRESEQMLLNVIDHMPLRIFWKDRESINQGCNLLHARHLGLESRDQFVGLTDYDFVPERAEEWVEADRQVMETGEAMVNVEDYADNPYDPEAWMRFSKIPIRNTSEEIHGVLVLIEDITERKLAELELQKREQWYRSLARSLPKTSVLLFDKNYRFVIAEGVEAYAPQEQIENHTIQEVLPPDLLEELFPFYQSVLNGIQSKVERSVEDKIFDQDFVPVFDDNQDVIAGVLVSREVTVERQRERVIQENEERLRILFENLPIGLFLFDRTGEIQRVNQTALEVLGVLPEQLLNKNLFQVLPLFDFDLEKAKTNFQRTSSGEALVSEYNIRRLDGKPVVVELMTHPITIQDNPHLLTTMRDVTQQREAKVAMSNALAKEKELNELKSRFVSMASHEFRTPLASILAVVETLDAYRHKLTDDQIRNRLEKIKSHISFLTEIMEDVLLLARMQERRLTFDPVRLDLDSVCRSVVEEFETLGVEQRIEYNFDIQVPEVYLDRKLIRQVITNLISNAIKYSSDDKPITFDIQQDDDIIILTVQDTGIGIPEEDLKHLFEPFHRAGNVGNISGTGLGLVITKEAVELHNGTITVESQVNVGTTFIIRIPVNIEGN